MAVPQRTSSWEGGMGLQECCSVLLLNLGSGSLGNIGVLTSHRFTHLFIYDACTFLSACPTSIESWKILICLNKLLFHEQTLVLLKLPTCSLSLIKADLFIVLLWQWSHHHSLKSLWRVERVGQHLPLHLCVQECISGSCHTGSSSPASNTTNASSFCKEEGNFPSGYAKHSKHLMQMTVHF